MYDTILQLLKGKIIYIYIMSASKKINKELIIICYKVYNKQIHVCIIYLLLTENKKSYVQLR